ncbi:MAG: DUF6464 family protein [Cyanobacteria bacterium P01_C01_bin.70]
MESSLPPTELILNHPRRSLGRLQLNLMPQPGSHIVYDEQVYTVLERRHRYQFIANRYQLHKIVVYVQPAVSLSDKSWLGDRWIIGDVACQYNAQSEIIRCAVNPCGPCDGCHHYYPHSFE